MKKMFTYQKPFVTDLADEAYPTYLTNEDREYEQDLRRVCYQFAIRHRLIISKPDNKDFFIQPVISDLNSWIYSVNWMNFRSLVDSQQYKSFLSRLLTQHSNERTTPIEAVIDLHTRIGCLFDHSFLDIMVNRVMQSISFIPYTDEKSDLKTWIDIHKELPWLWCLIYTQTLIRTDTSE